MFTPNIKMIDMQKRHTIDKKSYPVSHTNLNDMYLSSKKKNIYLKMKMMMTMMMAT